MDRDEILMGLYDGRTIVHEEFEKYFQPDGTKEDCYVHYVGCREAPQFELHANAYDGVVEFVETTKYETCCCFGRPGSSEVELTSYEKKYAYDIFDRCFRAKSADEIDAVIDKAVEKQVEYGGYRITKRMPGGIQFIAPDGKTGKLLAKRLLQALDFSHSDIHILRDAETAANFMSIMGKTPFQPLFAILQTVDATKYPNYNEMDNAYRFDVFQKVVSSGNIELCKDYEDLFEIYPAQINQL